MARLWEEQAIQTINNFTTLVDIPRAKEKLENWFTTYIEADESDFERVDRKSVCLVYREVQGLLTSFQNLKESGAIQEGGIS